MQTEEVTSFILSKSHQLFVFLEKKFQAHLMRESEDASYLQRKSLSQRERGPVRLQ